jgi:uncharacterized protein (TIGR00730 family)
LPAAAPRGSRFLCVFAGSSVGRRGLYAAGAQKLARAAVARGYGVVYGGGRVGLMGVLADAALVAGGEVIGVIPEALATKELAHGGLTRLEVVPSMHQRKARMAELATAFVALPGGVGTLEEIAEVYTWAQLGLHAKPCGLLDVAGYWDELGRQLDRAVAERFLRVEHRRMLILESDAERLIDRLEAYSPPRVTKWIAPDEI